MLKKSRKIGQHSTNNVFNRKNTDYTAVFIKKIKSFNNESGIIIISIY